MAYTDAMGNVIGREYYTPYGESLNPPTTDDTVSFTGHVRDSDTGLLYMQARYYDPVIGRFLSTDPVTFSPDKPQQFNRYWYANGNPYSNIDPDGRSALTKLIKLAANGGDMAATFAGVVEDANTVMDSSASTTDRVIAGASLASELLPVSARDVGDAAGFIKGLAKKSCCFVAGTQVLTREGYKNIEDVQLGEELWAKNVETGEQAWKRVTKVFVEPGRGVYEIVLADEDGFEQKIEATDDHPFWVEGAGWKTTIELQPGDRVETDGNGAMMVQSITDEHRQDVTYNFTVADFHTYYVTERNVLVHNCTLGKDALRSAAKGKGVPSGWISSGSKKGGGVVLSNPENAHDRVRIMPGNPDSPNPAQQGPYVKRQIDGNYYDKNGNVVSGNSPEAHIPLDDFQF